MRRSAELNISQIQQYYDITEDGQVWTKLKHRWLKPHQNTYGYIFYHINKGVDHSVCVFAHTLVALKYIGPPPVKGMEIDHKDDNKANNHWNNLQWMTHSHNILKSYQQGRTSYWRGKTRPAPGIETRIKMANAKNKRIQAVMGDQTYIYQSINDAASQLQTYRKRIYLAVKTGKPIRGCILTVVPDER
jgi:hypothetical protein